MYRRDMVRRFRAMWWGKGESVIDTQYHLAQIVTVKWSKFMKRHVIYCREQIILVSWLCFQYASMQQYYMIFYCRMVNNFSLTILWYMCGLLRGPQCGCNLIRFASVIFRNL